MLLICVEKTVLMLVHALVTASLTDFILSETAFDISENFLLTASDTALIIFSPAGFSTFWEKFAMDSEILFRFHYKDSDKIIYIPDVVENYDFSDPHLHKKKKAYSHLISRINVEWILDESEERCFVNNLENLKKIQKEFDNFKIYWNGIER